MNSSNVTQPDILAWIQTSTLGHAISKSNHLLIAGFQVIHVMGFVLLLLAAVLMQILLFQRVSARESATPLLARISVAISLVLWFGVSLAGRAIGFV